MNARDDRTSTSGAPTGGGGGEVHHVESLLDRYRTGELSEAEGRSVADHLEACPGCRAALIELETFATTIGRGYEAARIARASEREPDWARLRASVVARTSGREAARQRGWLARHVPQAAAAVLALVAIGVLYEQGLKEPADADRTVRAPAPSVSERAVSEQTGVTRGAPQTDAPETARDNAADSREPGEYRVAKAPPADRDATPIIEGNRGVSAARLRARGEARQETDEEAPPAAREDRAANENRVAAPPEAAAKVGEVSREAAVEEIAEGERVATDAVALGPEERFAARARRALASRDTALARDALGQWQDSLSARTDLSSEFRRTAEALADSLAAFLATRP